MRKNVHILTVEAYNCINFYLKLKSIKIFDVRKACFTSFCRKYAPRCCACKLPIAPKAGETTAQRLTAFDKDWHPDCFRCEVILSLTEYFSFLKMCLKFLSDMEQY